MVSEKNMGHIVIKEAHGLSLHLLRILQNIVQQQTNTHVIDVMELQELMERLFSGQKIGKLKRQDCLLCMHICPQVRLVMITLAD